MNATLRNACRGGGTAVLSALVFALAIGCFNALLLLVISMEEGDQGLTDSIAPFTQAVVLYAQGVGLEYGALRLTVIPLGLTLALIALLRAFAMKAGVSVAGYVGGLVVWELIHLWASLTCAIALTDGLPVSLAKTALVFSIGYLWAAVRCSEPMRAFVSDKWSALGERPRFLLRAVCRGFVLMAVTLALIALATVVYWVVTGHAAMGTLFSLLGMDTGSAIMTTIVSLIWLPNVMIWALSWLCGAGFSIGDVAAFTLWSGQASGLPAVPFFGLFPQPVGNDTVRFVLVFATCIPALAIGSWQLYSPAVFDVYGTSVRQESGFVSMDTVRSFLWPAVALCGQCVLLSVSSAVVFALSDGSLGAERLRHVGVDVVSSTQAIVRPAAVGLLIAWFVSLIVVAGRAGVLQLAARLRDRRGAAGSSSDDAGEAGTAHGEAAGDDTTGPSDTRGPRTVSSRPI